MANSIFGPEVVRSGALDMQVCVPEAFTDAEVIAFAEQKNPSGTQLGWKIRRAGDAALAGQPERVTCSGAVNGRTGFVHIMLDA